MSDKLIIISQESATLSPGQQNFNRLIVRLAKMKSDFQRKEAELDLQLHDYLRDIFPLEKIMSQLQIETIKLIYNVYKEKGALSRREKKDLRDWMGDRLEEIFSGEEDEPDKICQEIWKLCFKERFDETADRTFNEQRDHMQSMMDDMGIDVDLSEMDRNTPDHEVFKKFSEAANEREAAQKFAEGRPRKKTKKQLEKEAIQKEKQELQYKNINTLYRQLARLFHPDLEQDLRQKENKEILMKKLTVAYKDKDLYTMLQMEVDWISSEQNKITNASEEKLTTYNRVLSEQISEQREKIYALKLNPKYHPLKRILGPLLKQKKSAIEREKCTLKEGIKHTQHDILLLQGPSRVKVVKSILETQQVYDFASDFENYF